MNILLNVNMQTAGSENEKSTKKLRTKENDLIASNFAALPFFNQTSNDPKILGLHVEELPFFYKYLKKLLGDKEPLFKVSLSEFEQSLSKFARTFETTTLENYRKYINGATRYYDTHVKTQGNDETSPREIESSEDSIKEVTKYYQMYIDDYRESTLRKYDEDDGRALEGKTKESDEPDESEEIEDTIKAASIINRFSEIKDMYTDHYSSFKFYSEEKLALISAEYQKYSGGANGVFFDYVTPLGQQHKRISEDIGKYQTWYKEQITTPGTYIYQFEESENAFNKERLKLTRKRPEVLKDEFISVFKNELESGVGGKPTSLEKGIREVGALMKVMPLEQILAKQHTIIQSSKKTDSERRDFGYSITADESIVKALLTNRRKIEVGGRDRINKLLERLGGTENLEEKLAIKEKLLKAAKQLYEKELGPKAYKQALKNPKQSKGPVAQSDLPAAPSTLNFDSTQVIGRETLTPGNR